MSDPERLRLVVHELRSPVAALGALAAAVGDAPPDRRRPLIELAVAAVRDIERILGDAEALSLRLEAVDVGELASTFSSDAVTVTAPGRTTALADPTRLRQAIANLVQNGLRHGGRVTVSVSGADEMVTIDVLDAGPGVAPGIDPFARGTSTVGSTGLGLWLARGVAEAHGGALTLVPTAGGARFRLALPRSSGER